MTPNLSGQLNLLLIDDDVLDRMNTIRMLKRSVWQVQITEATTAEQALALIEQHQFDIILLDYQLPATTGLEVLDYIQSETDRRVPIVMLSHSDDIELATHCIEAGAHDFITKSEVTVSRLCRSIVNAKERFRIEKQLRDSQEKFRQLSELDSLTGLANRYMFDIAIGNAIALAQRQEKKLALILIDLDGFKSVNDTYGHDAGDVLLKEVAARIQATVRSGDIACRLGGDEYAILLQNLDDESTARKLAERIAQQLTQPVVLPSTSLRVGASMGIATYPDSASEAAQLIKCADIAMYRAKQAGKNQVHFYSLAMHNDVQQRIQLERLLPFAIERNELVIHYQAQVCAKTQKLLGAEAFVRWQHPQLGLLSPKQFIPIVEDMGIIDQIGLWVFNSSCKQLAQWRRTYRLPDFIYSIAVNLSAMQLSDSGMSKVFEDIVTQNGLSPTDIELELTENALLPSQTAKASMQQLTQFGIRLALDDFGLGHASLSLLQDYPFSLIKIDESFIQKITDSSHDYPFLRAISAFAKTMNMEVIAEGIETEDQFKVCKELAFDRVQGYYFSEPMTAEAFEQQWLQAGAELLTN